MENFTLLTCLGTDEMMLALLMNQGLDSTAAEQKVNSNKNTYAVFHTFQSDNLLISISG